MRLINSGDLAQLRILEDEIGRVASGEGNVPPADINNIIDKLVKISYCTMPAVLADKVKGGLYEIRIILLNILNGSTNITHEVLQGLCVEFNFVESNFIERYEK